MASLTKRQLPYRYNTRVTLVLVLSDFRLADGDGLAVLREVRQRRPELSFVLMTAYGSIQHAVEAVRAGADDYLAKPFEVAELIARLRALERRRSQPTPSTLTFADLELNVFRLEVRRGGHTVRLSRKEFAVLHQLMQAGGGVVSAEQLLEKSWDENANPFTNAIRVTMSSLRKKLGEPWIIQTSPGSGYRMAGQDD